VLFRASDFSFKAVEKTKTATRIQQITILAFGKLQKSTMNLTLLSVTIKKKQAHLSTS